MAAIAAGPGALQLRDKGLDAATILRRTRRLLGPCRAHGVRLLVNGRVDVALAAGCDGVHLPGDGIPPSEAKRILPAGSLVGRSVHREDELATSDGADFLFFGPVFDTPSKRAFGEPQGLERLERICSRADRPVIAVGGIVAARVPDALAAGAAGVAVIGAVLGAGDPGAAVSEILEASGRTA